MTTRPSLLTRTVQAISRIALAILRAIPLLNALYLGSKARCSYEFSFKKTLSKEETAAYLPHAAAIAHVFTGNAEEFVLPLDWKPIAAEELAFSDPDLKSIGHAYWDKKTGLKMGLVEKGDEILIAFPGLPSSSESKHHKGSKDYLSMIRRDSSKPLNLLGYSPPCFSQAEKAVRSILALDRFKGKKISLVGQCWGGAVASYLALKLNLPAVSFNTLQLGVGLQAEIGDEALKRADQLITHVCVKGDFLTTLKSVEIVDRILSFLHIRTPGNFGQKVLIPSAYPSYSKSHAFVLGSLMHYLGHGERATPLSISQPNPAS